MYELFKKKYLISISIIDTYKHDIRTDMPFTLLIIIVAIQDDSAGQFRLRECDPTITG